MSYQSDFGSVEGWDGVDVATKLNKPAARAFVDYLKAQGVDLIVRYYASSARPKTITATEARFLSQEGFAILPVFQDVHRKPENFGAANGRANAASALAFARNVGQPGGTTIIFAADADFSESETDDYILPFFHEVRTAFDGEFRIGAYGSGLVLSQLKAAGLIDVPWLSMSRLFRGTKDYFYSKEWAFRQVPPDLTQEGVSHDRNILNWSLADIGAFHFAVDGTSVAIAALDADHDAVLGSEHFSQPSTPAAQVAGNAYVSAEGLTFRERPEGAIARPLTIREPVTDIDARPPRRSTEVRSDDAEDDHAQGRAEGEPVLDEDDDCGDNYETPLEELARHELLTSANFTSELSGPSALGSNIYFTNARDGLNLRSGPGTDFPIIRSLALGTQVRLVRREGSWGLIDERGDGAADGFVHLAFLREGGSAEERRGPPLSADQVRAFWVERNPRGARLYDRFGNPLVDPSLLHASAVAITELEEASSSYRYEMYGPGGGFRTSGSTRNHGGQPLTGRGAAMDFVIIDRRTRRMLTNHPGKRHQNQGTVGENAPIYQRHYNAVVRAGARLYSLFERRARFGGYFATGANAMDTMHIDMRGEEASTGGGSLERGFTREQMLRWEIPENHPYPGLT